MEVDFAEPFPAGAADVAGFAPRYQGQYAACGDTTLTLVLGHRMLVQQRWTSAVLPKRLSDSLGVPRRAGRYWLRGQLTQVQPLADSTVRVHWLQRDTAMALGTGNLARLRRYRGWYYISQPAPAYPGRWQVQRLAIVGTRLTWQQMGADSLRLQALDAETRELNREPRSRHITLHPHTRRTQKQVNGYAGLWQTQGDYQRQLQN